MQFTDTGLAGAYIVEPDLHEDQRGFFARTFCKREFGKLGLATEFVQDSMSFNTLKGTLRGMHYQAQPHGEAKLVCCSQGAIHDVIIDLRPDSPTFTRSFGTELSAENRRAIYVPVGFAHGFLTLTDQALVQYKISGFYDPDASRGVRWDDPAFGINWPAGVVQISERDASYPDFSGMPG